MISFFQIKFPEQILSREGHLQLHATVLKLQQVNFHVFTFQVIANHGLKKNELCVFYGDC